MKTTMPNTPDKVASPNKEWDLTQKIMQGESLIAPIISKLDLIVAKVPNKAAISFNIVEQMKRASINVSIWDALAIPSQRDLLQEEIKGMDVAKGSSQGCNSSISTSLV